MDTSASAAPWSDPLPAATAARPPRATELESGPALLREGYEFGRNRQRLLGSDAFEIRLMLRPTTVLIGRDAAELFYDAARFQREGAPPSRLPNTLFGRGGVQSLDGDAHHHRKRLMMDVMTRERVEDLAALFHDGLRRASERWQRRGSITLFHEVNEVLCAAVCRWAGVPLASEDVPARTREFADMIDAPGALGPRYLRGRFSRDRSERWIEALIDRVRRDDLEVDADAPLARFARHRDHQGELLPARVAAVEVINLLRPTVAIGRYVAFAAHALHLHPHLRAEVVDDPGMELPFVQEVRRFYPFFPFVAAKVREAFTWRGLRFPGGRRTLLDLYATNHDARLWPDPDHFSPERFRAWSGDRFAFIPQGGGDFGTGHRCAGEWVTISLLQTAVRFLTHHLRYVVPPQNLRIDLARFPTLPASGFVMGRIEPTGSA